MRLSADQLSLVCDYCKSVYFCEPDDEGVRVLDQARDAFCPVCEVALMNATLAGVPIRYCQRCRGTLVEMGRFETLLEALRWEKNGIGAPSVSDRSELSRTIRCPQCHNPMETHFYYGGGHVVIDDCPRCSLNWLDHGELKRIAAAAAGSGSNYNE